MLNNLLLFSFNLGKYYKNGSSCINVLNNINFSLQYGEMVAIMGSSGSGKSTFLHLLGGIDEPNTGEVFFEGKSLYKLPISARVLLRNRRLSFIYQFYHLLSDFNVIENVSMPLRINGISSKIANSKAKIILNEVNLIHRLFHFPNELSGGEKQRVAIARALISNPILILADEPTGNLDQINAKVVFNLLKKFNKRSNIAFLIATHDAQLADLMDRKYILCNGTLQSI